MPSKPSSPRMQHRAQELRKEPTDSEARLWQYLRANRFEGIHFRRQYAIGHYIVDFCSPRAKLIIELDGSQHLDQQYYDAERTRYLVSLGYRVLRFWNNDVLNNVNGVLTAIQDALAKR